MYTVPVDAVMEMSEIRPHEAGHFQVANCLHVGTCAVMVFRDVSSTPEGPDPHG